MHKVCIKLKFAYMCQLICLEALHSSEQVFIDSYFVSEMRVMADEQIFELVNSTAANTVFYDAKNTPWAKFRLINSGYTLEEQNCSGEMPGSQARS